MHCLVKWADNVRYAKCSDTDDAKRKCFGIIANDMRVVELPSAPKYISRKKLEQYYKVLNS